MRGMERNPSLLDMLTLLAFLKCKIDKCFLRIIKNYFILIHREPTLLFLFLICLNIFIILSYWRWESISSALLLLITWLSQLCPTLYFFSICVITVILIYFCLITKPQMPFSPYYLTWPSLRFWTTNERLKYYFLLIMPIILKEMLWSHM